MDKLLSIIIATKGREYYCVKTIEAILTLLNNNSEIVISDNSDSDYIEENVIRLDDSRIIYKHTREIITVSENYNIAIDNSSGKYLCMIGDDDGILSNIYKALQFAIDNDIDAISQNVVINYVWPEKGKTNGTLYLTEFTEKEESVDVGRSLIRYLENGSCTNPRDFNLPAIYHGLVKKSILTQIKNATGDYILGVSPDSYTSVALACFIKKQYCVYYPFTIGGACQDSWSAQNMRKSYCGPIRSNSQFALNEKKHGYIWHKMIPQYYSVQTIWAESSLQALSILDKEIIAREHFSLKNLTKDSIPNNRSIIRLIIKETSKVLKEENVAAFPFYTSICFSAVKTLFKKIYGRIVKSKPLYSIVENNVGEIDSIISRLCKDPKYIFK